MISELCLKEGLADPRAPELSIISHNVFTGKMHISGETPLCVQDMC